MKCQKCGYELNNGEVICPNCGNKTINDNSINNQTDNNVETNMINNSQNEQIPNTTINNNPPLNNNQQEQINTNQTRTKPKKKKNYWWIPVLLFSSFIITNILCLSWDLISSSANDGVRPNEIYKTISSFLSILRLFGFLACGLTIPSIGLVIFLNYKDPKEPTEEDIKLNNLINDNNANLDDRLLAAYIGKNYEKIMKQKFSIPALLFNEYYMLYRKMYVPSLIILGILIINTFIFSSLKPIFGLIFIIVLGIMFNKWYIKYSKKQIEKIKKQNTNANDNELIELCKRKGGTDIIYMIIIMIVYIIINSICQQIAGNNNSLSGIIGLSNSNEVLKYTVPSGYKANKNNYKTREDESGIGPYLSFKDSKNNCEIFIGIFQTNETVEESFNNSDEPVTILEQNINQINWKYIVKDGYSENEKQYNYKYIKNNIEYYIDFNDEENNICPQKRQEFLNSLSIVEK